MRHEMIPFTTATPATRQTGAHPFGLLQTRMNRLFDDLWGDLGAAAPGTLAASGFAPTVDVQDDDGMVHVTAEIPGLTEDQIAVDFAGGMLRIAGEKAEQTADDGRRNVVSERVYGRFERRLPIGRDVDADNITADFRDGVLTVTLPKAAKAENTRRIDVKRSG